MTVKDHGNAGNKCSIQFKNGSHAQEQSVCGFFYGKGCFFILRKTEKGVYEYKIEKEGRNGSDKYERGGKRGG